MKRIFDTAISLIALIFLSPLILILAVLLRRRLGKIIFFRQDSPGLNGQTFEMMKFRSMLNRVDKDRNQLPDEKRLTNFGKLLRASSLDKLPGLRNVLKSEMILHG